MLFLLFSAGGERLGVAGREVVEVLPLVELRQPPRGPGWMAGLLDYRGRLVPVIDLGELAAGRRSRPLYSTRIIVVDATADPSQSSLVGLLAEGVTEVVRADDAAPAPAGPEPGVTARLEELVCPNGTRWRRVRLEGLLSEEVRGVLSGLEQPAS